MNGKLIMVRSLLVAVCIVIAFGSPRARSADKSPVATMHKPVGTVEYNTDGTWKKAVPAMPLFTDDLVRTGVSSFAIIKFLEGSILRVQEQSEVAIQGTKSSGNDLSKNVHVRQGTVGFNVKKRPNERFLFSTPTSVASIRGTGGALISDPDSSDLLVLESGVVELTNNFSNRAVTVHKGESGLSLPDGQIAVRPSLAKDVLRMRRVQSLGTTDTTGTGGSIEGQRQEDKPSDEVRIKTTDPNGAQKTIIIKFE
jgi:hypothetical protein